MKCAADKCEQEHEHYVKTSPKSLIVPMCEPHAKGEKETEFVDLENAKKSDEVEDYLLSYDPDEAVAEKLSEAWHIVEKAVTRYEGDNHRDVETAVNGQQKMGEAIERLVG